MGRDAVNTGDLAEELGKAADVDETTARAVVETAMAYVAARRPHLARRVARMLSERKRAAGAASRIAYLARRFDPRNGEVTDT